eukprot:1161728-Pelagomonas_calceolata.AAC.9
MVAVQIQSRVTSAALSMGNGSADDGYLVRMVSLCVIHGLASFAFFCARGGGCAGEEVAKGLSTISQTFLQLICTHVVCARGIAVQVKSCAGGEGEGAFSATSHTCF